jgi:aspartate/methionine/tyrosine aminotransferase
MFSSRLPSRTDANPLSRALARLTAEGVVVRDLTESNPTRVGLDYPADLLKGLATAAARRYDPQPLGLAVARDAVSADYRRRGAEVDPARVVLTASSSEAYSWIFKLLCNPGDSVLVPQPSYPLFEHLTRLEGVRAVPYHLHYAGRWEIVFDSLASADERVRAVVVVSPNNPTGSFVTPEETSHLAGICRARGWAIVADEVFADYPLDVEAPATEIAMNRDVLSFTLGGASKSMGLPQVKLGWIVVDGPREASDQAIQSLELIADTFLSVGTPVQVAAPWLFERAQHVRAQIRTRLSRNLSAARDLATRHPASTLLPVGGGWSLMARVPATRPEEELVQALLEREHVLVHPGYFFDCSHEAFLVVSLLPPTDVFVDGLERTLRLAGGEPLRP